MNKPLFVAISDIHFNLNNLELASQALQAAINKAEYLHIPIVIAGDLNDTKAIIRAEVANAIISILNKTFVQVYILEGNHDKVNEKGSEHGLNYLRPYAKIIDQPSGLVELSPSVVAIPYFSDAAELTSILDGISGGRPHGDIVIMHQGFRGAFMGDYIQDRSSISTDVVKNFTVISGHYHRHQTTGTVTYIGSPYTITYGEANDGPKGFLVVNEDGTFTREILNLRKHIIVERNMSNRQDPIPEYNPGDLVRIKLRGSRADLSRVDKHTLGLAVLGHSNYKLDLIPEDSTVKIERDLTLTDHELMVNMISTIPGNTDALMTTYLEVLDAVKKY